MKKTFLIYFIYFFYILFIYSTADILISNFYLKAQKQTCFDLKKDFYKLKKNCKGKEKTNAILPIVNILTNEYGQRFGSNQKTRKKKIFFFGDSFTYGIGVDYDDSFVEIFNKNTSDYQVFNFAVPSYSPSLYLYQLKKALNQNIVPNKIVIVLDLTDVHDETSRWEDNSSGKPRLVSKEYKRKHTPFKEFVYKNFQMSKILAATINRLNRKIKYVIKSSKNSEKYEINSTFQGSFTYTVKEKLSADWWKKGQFNSGIKKINKKINEISKLSKKHNSELFLLIYPWAETLQYGQKHFNWENFAYNLSKKYDLTLISMFPEFNKIKQKDKYWYNKLFFLKDIHLNEGGHKVIGNYLTKHLL